MRAPSACKGSLGDFRQNQTATMIDQKHILGMLIPEFPSQTHIFFWREIQALREMGCEVHIISTKRPGTTQNQHEFADEVKNTEYLVPFPMVKTLVYLLLHPLWLFRALAYCVKLQESSLAEKLKAMLFIPVAAHLITFVREKNIAHVHAHSCANSSHLVALAYLQNSLPYSITVHGNLSEYGKDHFSKMRHAKFVATVTKPLQTEVLEANPDFTEERVPVIAMGVDLSRFSVAGPRKDSSAPFKLTSISRLAFVKGHTYTLQALAKLPSDLNFHFSIVGDGEMREQLEKEVTELGLEEKVSILGFKPEGDVIKILEDTDIFLLTSFGFGEAAPVAVMEAMACGKAVVCSIIGGTRDMISDGEDGFLVAQKNVDQISDVLKRLMEDGVLMNDMGHKARKAAEEKFSHKNSAKKLCDSISVDRP